MHEVDIEDEFNEDEADYDEDQADYHGIFIFIFYVFVENTVTNFKTIENSV